MITDYIVSKTGLNLFDEPTNSNFKMFNTGGVECEVGEFFYSLVRMMKPTSILETGTHFGISSTYFGLALKHNNKGVITTLDPAYYEEAKLIHKTMELEGFVNQVAIHAENFKTDELYDIILLDSEPKLRFNEFDLFYKNLKPGGLIMIHDLHSHLSYGSFNKDHPDFIGWPFGDFREKIGKYIESHEIQTISFSTPRGLTIFQKKTDQMTYIKLINKEL